MLPRDTINHLQQVMGHGGHQAFQTVPKILAKVIRKELWKGRLNKAGKPFASFEEFATARLQEGLETTIDDLFAFCRRNDEALRLLNNVLEASHRQGRPNKGNTVTFYRRGNSPTYRRKRLKRDRPDLFERVLAGELTLIAAEIEAGIKKASTPYRELCRIWKRASDKERQRFLSKVAME